MPEAFLGRFESSGPVMRSPLAACVMLHSPSVRRHVSNMAAKSRPYSSSSASTLKPSSPGRHAMKSRKWASFHGGMAVPGRTSMKSRSDFRSAGTPRGNRPVLCGSSHVRGVLAPEVASSQESRSCVVGCKHQTCRVRCRQCILQVRACIAVPEHDLPVAHDLKNDLKIET
jgi:hypothetical protein